MSTLRRLALGQKATIGALYDARKEAFLDGSLLTGEIPQTAIVSTTQNQTEITAGNTGSIKEKYELLQVDAELGASFLAGLTSPRGSGRYLAQQGDSVPTAERAVVYTVRTRTDQLSFMMGNIRENLNLDALATSRATHVLTGITWGARAVVSVRKRITQDTDLSKCEKVLADVLKGVLNPAENEYATPTSRSDDTIDVRLYTDAREALDGPADTITDVLEHFNQLESHVQASGGKPLVYTLVPVTFLVTLGAMVPSDATAGQLSPECYDRLVGLVDHLGHVQRALNAHHQTLMHHRALVSDSHFAKVEDQLKKAREAESRARARYPETLEMVRANQATSKSVIDIIDSVRAEILSPQDLDALTDKYNRRLDFLSRMVERGAMYIQDEKLSPEVLIQRTSTARETLYVFRFNEAVMDVSDTNWKENQQLLEELLAQANLKPPVYLIDTHGHKKCITQPSIAVVVNGTVVVEDLLEQKRELAGKPLVRSDRAFLEPTNDVPTYRKSLRIPCPGPYCDEQDLCLWACCDCHETIEFGSRDGYFYCDCGRVPFNRASFNCQGPRHKSGYFEFEPSDLHDLLCSLPAPREVNILILGETGVGKSTFVNAFVNYLTFSSLDEGLKNPKLNCIIPCSFTTQMVDEDGRMISKDVVVGRDKDEVDGSKGQSATQKATVYPLYFRDTLIRLIDTPGIGDTRGLEQDKQNMANMLSILRNYPSLHGILILLKPNNARLGVMFRFCVKELLTHLHASAAQNMVFGFTNTRGSNYTPGDTFKPLESLLSEYHSVIPQLSRNNVYCFDSESFRYLAARKEGIEMGNIDDYRRSWAHSSKEADRLLAHFQSLRPHHTQETLSLNETRHLIAKLTAPMQQISVAITDTIEKSEQQVRDLQHAELTGDELRAKLSLQKTTVKATQLGRPKTVCSNEKCVETAFHEGSQSEVLLRKNLCHNPCCLTNVPVGKVGTSELVNCAAFARSSNCTACKHHWREHEHILVEYSKKREWVTDPNVQRELATNGNEVKARKKAIKALQKHIDELRQEHLQVQTAAAKFSLYLKRNSITHYNDATVEYLEHLIKDERMKVRTGQSRARLESLEKDLDDYKKFVETMEQANSGGDSSGQVYVPLDEAGVAQLVQALYNLAHYGQMLKDLAQVVASAYEANFRERPYRISRNKYWRDYRDLQAPVQPLLAHFRHEGTGHSHGSATTGLDAEKSSAKYFSGLDSSPGGRRDFLPSSEQKESVLGPVQSIANWDPSANEIGCPGRAGRDGAVSNPFRGSSVPLSAPPPYPGSGMGSHRSNGEGQSEQIVLEEKKGIWLRLKGKLRKK